MGTDVSSGSVFTGYRDHKHKTAENSVSDQDDFGRLCYTAEESMGRDPACTVVQGGQDQMLSV